MKFARRKRPEVEVNLTPLIDVVFLLLIFFMVTTTFTKNTQLSIDSLGQEAWAPAGRFRWIPDGVGSRVPFSKPGGQKAHVPVLQTLGQTRMICRAETRLA